MRILVTGATGFIGRHLLPALVEQGHEVVGMVRRMPSRPVPGVRYLRHDLAHPLDTGKLPATLDAIIHQATIIEPEGEPPGSGHAPPSFPGPDATVFLVNVVATWRLLNYAHQAGARVFVHASTGGVYGCGQPPGSDGSGATAFTENSPLNPMDLYSLTKAQAELAVAASGYTLPRRSFAAICLRYFFPYGVGTPNPIPTYVAAAVRGETIDLPAGGGPLFNPIHIEDTVIATLAALALDRDAVINIAGREPTSFGAIAALAAQRAGRALQTRTLAPHAVIPYYRGSLLADTRHMQTLLGVSPQIDLATGLAPLIDFYRA